MKRLDLDDLPPKIAAMLEALEPGESLALVQHGAVVRRLTAETAPPPAADPGVPPEQHAHEVFENFRSAIEDEF